MTEKGAREPIGMEAGERRAIPLFFKGLKGRET